jgi:hypothetical protein
MNLLFKISTTLLVLSLFSCGKDETAQVISDGASIAVINLTDGRSIQARYLDMGDKDIEETCSLNSLRRPYVDEVDDLFKKAVDTYTVCSVTGISRDGGSQKSKGMSVGDMEKENCAPDYYTLCVKSI